MRNQRVFIYGTLKQGHYFHEKYLGQDQSTFLGKAIASKDYSLYVDGMPHLIKEPTDLQAKGELYLVDEVSLKRLDDLEGHPVTYKRELVDVYDELGERLLAWAYLRHPNFKGKQWAWREEEFV